MALPPGGRSSRSTAKGSLAGIVDVSKVSTVAELASLMKSMLFELDAKMDARNKDLDAKINDICSEFNNKIASVSAELNSNIQLARIEFDAKIEANNVTNLKRIDDLEKVVKHMKENSEMQFNWIERRHNQADLMLYGVPSTKNENVISIIRDICVKIQMELPCVIAAFRVRSRSNAMPIVVKLDTISSKQNLLSKYFKYKSLNLSDIGFESDKRLYICERLTKTDNTIFKMANELRKLGKIAKVSTRNGCVVIKKTNDSIFTYVQLADLEKL